MVPRIVCELLIMIIAKEVTDWDWNHTYLLSDDKMKCFGYWKWQEGDYHEFSIPMKFDKRKRKFQYKKVK